MDTLLEDLTAFITASPSATVQHLIDEFGTPVHRTAWAGSYKTYQDLIFHRGGQFVHVQHRDFANNQVIRCREVEPMEQIKTWVSYVPADGQGDRWEHTTGLVVTAENVMEALARGATG